MQKAEFTIKRSKDFHNKSVVEETNPSHHSGGMPWLQYILPSLLPYITETLFCWEIKFDFIKVQLKRQALRPRTAVEESSLFYFGLQLIQPTYLHTYTKTLSSFLLPETDGCSCIIDYFSICIYAPFLFIILSADEIHFFYFLAEVEESSRQNRKWVKSKPISLEARDASKTHNFPPAVRVDCKTFSR